jgi:hypothetical protein
MLSLFLLQDQVIVIRDNITSSIEKDEGVRDVNRPTGPFKAAVKRKVALNAKAPTDVVLSSLVKPEL